MVVNRWTRSTSRSFMAEQGREGCEQEQDCLTHRFQVIIINLPGTSNFRCISIEKWSTEQAGTNWDIAIFMPGRLLEADQITRDASDRSVTRSFFVHLRLWRLVVALRNYRRPSPGRWSWHSR